MRRKGWWQQLKSDEYPKTKTNYGDSRAVRSKPGNINLTLTSNEEPLKLQKECPNCGHTYWVEKGCYNCGYSYYDIKVPQVKTQQDKRIKKPHITKTRYRYTKEELDLLRKNHSFYISLETGRRAPKTEAQKHFVEVCQGLAKPKTTHEKAYIKFIRNRKIQCQNNNQGIKV